LVIFNNKKNIKNEKKLIKIFNIIFFYKNIYLKIKMIFTPVIINIKNEMKFNICLLYYKYFNPYIVNHYNIINKLNIYKSLGSSYYSKYPGASNWGNLNDKLFQNNPQAKKDFYYRLEQQEQIKKQIMSDIDFLSKKNKNYDICSDFFQSFYVKSDYHIDQNIDGVINYLHKDVMKNII